MNSLNKVEVTLVSGDVVSVEGDNVGHKFDQRNPDVIIGYANTKNVSQTIIVPIKSLLSMTVKEARG